MGCRSQAAVDVFLDHRYINQPPLHFRPATLSAMSGESPTTSRVSVADIFTPQLLEYAQQITFPWDLDKPLNANQVGQAFFSDHDPTEEWNVPEVRSALMKIAAIGIENVRFDDFPDFVLGAASDGGALAAWERNSGVIVTLDQGARYVCKGVNARYVYEFFQPIALHTIKTVAGQGMAHLRDWEAAGIDRNQAMIRALTSLGALIHSENVDFQDFHQWYISQLRKEYESLTRTTDPYRESLDRDSEDIDLYAQMIKEGPPQGKGVHMHDLIYWSLRYYTSHIAFLRHFGRSPFRNVAVGRDDAEGEAEWLRRCGVERSEGDEKVREMIKEDRKNGRWRSLEL